MALQEDIQALADRFLQFEADGVQLIEDIKAALAASTISGADEAKEYRRSLRLLKLAIINSHTDGQRVIDHACAAGTIQPLSGTGNKNPPAED